jgi:transposase
VIEACGAAHYLARELGRLGHRAKLIAPQLVKPYVSRNKNDGRGCAKREVGRGCAMSQ